MRIGKKEVDAVNIGKYAIGAIYRGLKILWDACNFRTKDDKVIMTSDGYTFNVKE